MGFDGLQREQLQQRLVVLNSHILLQVQQYLLGQLALILQLHFYLRRQSLKDPSEVELGRPDAQPIGGNPKEHREVNRQQLFLDGHLEGNAVVILILHELAEIDHDVLIRSELHPNVQRCLLLDVAHHGVELEVFLCLRRLRHLETHWALAFIVKL